MNLPDEILRIIYEYNLNISIPNKMIYEHVVEKKSNFAKRIQHWYKKNKIDSKMPILFLSDFTENPQQFDKWYVIRLFMKFYPREDLYHYPKYLIRTICWKSWAYIRRTTWKRSSSKVEKFKI